MGPHYVSPVQALHMKPYWSSGKLVFSSAYSMIEDDNFHFIFQENWYIYP